MPSVQPAAFPTFLNLIKFSELIIVFVVLRAFDLRPCLILLVGIVEFEVEKLRADAANHVLLELQLLVDKQSDFLRFHVEAVLGLHSDGVHHFDLALIEANDAGCKNRQA